MPEIKSFNPIQPRGSPSRELEGLDPVALLARGIDTVRPEVDSWDVTLVESLVDDLSPECHEFRTQDLSPKPETPATVRQPEAGSASPQRQRRRLALLPAATLLLGAGSFWIWAMRDQPWAGASSSVSPATSAPALQAVKPAPAPRNADAKEAAEKLARLQAKADQGDMWAEYELGNLYRTGTGGVRKSGLKASEWYRKAALQGCVEADVQLGNRAHWGLPGPGPVNWQRVIEYYRQAAEKGDAMYEYLYGESLRNGVHIRGDWNEAFKWLKKASDHGNVVAPDTIGRMYGRRGDEEESFKWIKIAAERGYVYAQNRLGAMYAAGLGCPADPQKAAEWFQKAANKGNQSSQTGLALLYLNGYGVPKDEAKAIALFHSSNDAIARDYLNRIAAGEKDFRESDPAASFQPLIEDITKHQGFRADFQAHLKAAESGNAEEQYIVSWWYAWGKGVEPNSKESALWLVKAAENGCATAQHDLGDLYTVGTGKFPKDEAKAAEWFAKEAKHQQSLPDVLAAGSDNQAFFDTNQ